MSVTCTPCDRPLQQSARASSDYRCRAATYTNLIGGRLLDSRTSYPRTTLPRLLPALVSVAYDTPYARDCRSQHHGILEQPTASSWVTKHPCVYSKGLLGTLVSIHTGQGPWRTGNDLQSTMSLRSGSRLSIMVGSTSFADNVRVMVAHLGSSHLTHSPAFADQIRAFVGFGCSGPGYCRADAPICPRTRRALPNKSI